MISGNAHNTQETETEGGRFEMSLSYTIRPVEGRRGGRKEKRTGEKEQEERKKRRRGGEGEERTEQKQKMKVMYFMGCTEKQSVLK